MEKESLTKKLAKALNIDFVMTKELWPGFKRYERICNEYAEKIMQSITCQIHKIKEDEVIED